MAKRIAMNPVPTSSRTECPGVGPGGKQRPARSYPGCVTVLVRLSEQRLDRVGWRLEAGRRFSVALPERTLVLQRPWDLCLVVAEEPLVWDEAELVPDEGSEPGLSVIALARIRSSPRPTTTDDRVMFAESTLIDPVPVATLVSTTGVAQRDEVRVAAGLVAAALSQPAGEAVVGALLRLRPDLGPAVERLRRGNDDEPVGGAVGEILVLERDAALLALKIAGVDIGPIEEWSGPSEEGFLASLAYETPEDVLVPHDAFRFPDWTARPGGRPDWITFGDGEHHICIGSVNKTKLENVLGVDLIYRHIEADSLVLVQYKRMRKDANGEWFYRPDKQLAEELDRMRRYDQQGDADDSPSTWRLHPRGFVVKLVRQPKEFDQRSDRLLSGLYLPLAYLDELLADDCTLTKKGARRLGYDTIDRYLTSDLFVALVRQGWIGTRGLTTKTIGRIINAAVDAGRSVVIAEEWGAQSGASRRSRPARD